MARNGENSGVDIPLYLRTTENDSPVQGDPWWETAFSKIGELLDMMFEYLGGNISIANIKRDIYFGSKEKSANASAFDSHAAFNDALKLRQSLTPEPAPVTAPGFNPLAQNALAMDFGKAASPVIGPAADPQDPVLGRIGPTAPNILGHVA